MSEPTFTVRFNGRVVNEFRLLPSLTNLRLPLLALRLFERGVEERQRGLVYTVGDSVYGLVKPFSDRYSR